jgi:rubrerythrin
MDKIQEALNQAYAGEAKAALRLKVYAQKAEDEGYNQMARLFRVISFSEEIHGARALRVLREIKGTEENLAASFESEKKVAEVAYDQFVKLAEEAGSEPPPAGAGGFLAYCNTNCSCPLSSFS